MTEKMTIRAGTVKVETWRDDEWIILYVEDGSGAKTTISLDALQALDLATLLRGYGITAAISPCDCAAATKGKWADIHAPGCSSLQR